jgi:hypothetical protein
MPRLLGPSENVIAPVGGLSAAELTVAVKVTGCPNTEGFADELNEVFVMYVRLVTYKSRQAGTLSGDS